MGGGIGLSIHGTFRLATEHATFAMPETQLGLFPDVGGSYFLPRLRGAFGMYLGLTGTRVGAANACWLGIATHYVARAALPALIADLANDGLSALSRYTVLPPAARPPSHRSRREPNLQPSLTSGHKSAASRPSALPGRRPP